MQEISYVYILASGFKHLYVGVTANLDRRIYQHRNETDPESFTARNNIKQLVYFERFADISSAIAREKQLKRWSRIKKVRLIVAENPTWSDLSKDWGKPIKPFEEKDLKPPRTFRSNPPNQITKPRT
jgi:putative endonuclease